METTEKEVPISVLRLEILDPKYGSTLFLDLLIFCCIAPAIHAQDVLKEVADSAIVIDGKKIIIEQEFRKF